MILIHAEQLSLLDKDMDKLYTVGDLLNEAKNSDILYHGTSETTARKIASSGTLTIGESNWTTGGEFEPMQGRVYLTRGLYQALAYAVMRGESLGIVTVTPGTIDLKDLLLDEDILSRILQWTANDVGLGINYANFEDEFGLTKRNIIDLFQSFSDHVAKSKIWKEKPEPKDVANFLWGSVDELKVQPKYTDEQRVKEIVDPNFLGVSNRQKVTRFRRDLILKFLPKIPTKFARIIYDRANNFSVPPPVKVDKVYIIPYRVYRENGLDAIEKDLEKYGEQIR